MNSTQKAVQRAVDLLGSQSALAKAVGKSQPAIYKWTHGKALPTWQSAIAIERATAGRVTRHEIRPDVEALPIPTEHVA
jgi:DNA-binding transcriptional regulator YdaS (Cro superfamily)